MKTWDSLKKLITPLLFAVLVLLFCTAVSNLQFGHSTRNKAQLEDALARAAIACYAVEGIYPPDLQYLVEHYGIQINNDLYAVKYEAIASNLMPDITVLEK
ncbi:MAG: hypothetical protein E7286_06310 [Lachnospiraceae bacterium]|nr:hypothetical protein [Lachnospiraceae bacterium]